MKRTNKELNGLQLKMPTDTGTHQKQLTIAHMHITKTNTSIIMV